RVVDAGISCSGFPGRRRLSEQRSASGRESSHGFLRAKNGRARSLPHGNGYLGSRGQRGVFRGGGSTLLRDADLSGGGTGNSDARRLFISGTEFQGWHDMDKPRTTFYGYGRSGSPSSS